MIAVTLNHYFVLSAILFGIGLYGIMRRKNLLMLFFATEMLLNAANISFVAMSSYFKDSTGQIFALFIIAIAASEVAVGLGFLILMYKRQGSINLDKLQIMKG
jgi:NADH-quinone oxidoreductase subunit K